MADTDAQPSDPLERILRILEARVADADDLHALFESLGDARKPVQRGAVDALVALETQRQAIYARLLAALASPMPRLRWGAAFALSQIGAVPPPAVSVLIESLGADDGDVRWAAAGIVARLAGDPRVVDILRNLLASGNAAQRKMAAYCLREIGSRAVDTQAALLLALDDEDAAVRIAALSSLAHLAANPDLVAGRFLLLLDDADERVRRSAAAALGHLGQHSRIVIDALDRAAHSLDASLRRAAERSLRLLAE